MADPKTKPYLKLAYGLIIAGVGIFSLERFGLPRLSGANHTVSLDSTTISILVIVPLALVAAGAVVFMYGKIRRL